MSDPNVFKSEFLEKYNSIGEYKFYQYLLAYAINKITKIKNNNFKGTTPELEFLEYSEKFIQLHRRTSEDIHKEMSRIFRKAAHKIYRVMLRQNIISKNDKFLNLV